jgi:hypothetical protein
LPIGICEFAKREAILEAYGRQPTYCGDRFVLQKVEASSMAATTRWKNLEGAVSRQVTLPSFVDHGQ